MNTKIAIIGAGNLGTSLVKGLIESKVYTPQNFILTRRNISKLSNFKELGCEIATSNIDAVAVSKGPGSYTGLRIGVSAAKGLCFAFGKPLISIKTLESLANAISVDKGMIVPMLDARRMEVYAAVFDKNYYP